MKSALPFIDRVINITPAIIVAILLVAAAFADKIMDIIMWVSKR